MSSGERTFYTREQVREIDRRAIEDVGLPGIVLMENAGCGCVELLHEANVCGPVAICCGRGNNGGDGYVIARHLENSGVEVQVLVFADCEAITGDAGVNLQVLRAAGTPVREMPHPFDPAELDGILAPAEWIVDALLGTGTRGEIREPFVGAIEAVNRASAPVFAVDLPSGLDCDKGEPLGPCVRADLTGTFVGRKLGFRNPAAAQFTGNVRVIDIGVPQRILTSTGNQEE